MDSEQLFTLSEVAAYCDVPDYVVQRWVNRKQIVVCYLTNGRPRFRMADIVVALEAHIKRISGINESDSMPTQSHR